MFKQNVTIEPLLSAIIPYYNVGRNLIENCLESILAQSYQNYEVIIIDDGSEDEFSLIVDELSNKDQRISVWHQDNQGVSVARNLGVELAKGDYVTFVDADDEIAPFFFAEAMRIIIDTDVDEVIGANITTDNIAMEIEKDESTKYRILSGQERYWFRQHLLGKVYRVADGGAGIGRGSVARIIRMSIARKVKFNSELVICEDGIWNLETLNKCNKICVVEQIWYKYYRNPQSATRKFNPEIIRQCEQYFAEIPKHIDMGKDEDYCGYVERIMELLWLFVYKSFLGHPQGITTLEKEAAVRHLYTSSPWTKISEARYFRLTSKKNKIKSLLYKHKLLLLYWDIKAAWKKLH
ncbi:glycosyltransferase involved in cell wall biosynthesis [Lachnospiraceae bacterium PM6-15]|uniref:Glycosyltransferase n=1 Tax=Ohessyouella blattaphilus TaxID=2949333 RepID=A0ABT1EG74_9FIRM|nr:glycosyltransferase [Ohessyouella blattaphilus]MCP1109489.1 glycosyltransferase [Ohessyouella blattaphilus]MCR8562883.1 glycosyltransferase [Ohessyouella blattaphilus]